MSKPLFEDAYGHHVWATLRLLDACAELSPEQLATTVPGTYGSILETLRHLVAADASYVHVLGGEKLPEIDEESMGLRELRAVVERNATAWPEIVASYADPEEIVVRHRTDGSESHVARGFRMAQVLHHGSDHRSQICTALTTMGIEPPEIDVWDYARFLGRVVETAPTA